ncbi:MAG: preprotein translocase subunit SecG [Clostridia bacterium]|nr:preprotein translocase subunit SecG [Clostridia bacterium]
MSVTVYYILMGVLLVMGAFLIVAVLMQHGKDHGLSGTIAGGAETFFGKDKGTRIDRMLGKLTTIVGIIFVVIVIVVYVVQPDYSSDYANVELWQGNSSFWNAING